MLNKISACQVMQNFIHTSFGLLQLFIFWSRRLFDSSPVKGPKCSCSSAHMNTSIWPHYTRTAFSSLAPVAFRINFKMLILVFKSIHGLAPLYCSEMLCLLSPVRGVQSSDRCLLDDPRTWKPGRIELL